MIAQGECARACGGTLACAPNSRAVCARARVCERPTVGAGQCRARTARNAYSDWSTCAPERTHTRAETATPTSPCTYTRPRVARATRRRAAPRHARATAPAACAPAPRWRQPRRPAHAPSARLYAAARRSSARTRSPAASSRPSRRPWGRSHRARRRRGPRQGRGAPWSWATARATRWRLSFAAGPGVLRGATHVVYTRMRRCCWIFLSALGSCCRLLG